MTCRCKAQFCYICGLQWRTCACRDAQLATIQQRAEIRRVETARTARQAAEAEEERIVVQMVADFIAREAEAQQRHHEEERRRKEVERLAAVHLHFRQLVAELESLHDVQRILMTERYEVEVEALKIERQEALDTLSIRHASELQSLATESHTRIADSEHRFEKEYQTRLAEERLVEDEYVNRLRAYWKGKSEADYTVRAARDELRTKLEKEDRFWDSYRRMQLQAIVEGEKRKMEASRAKQAAEIKVVDERASIGKLEWKRKRWAEGKWEDDMIRERIEMLQEIEQEEYARGN